MPEANRFPSPATWRAELKPVVETIHRAIVGRDEGIRLVLTALLAGGHCLLEDVPGVGKTMLVKAVARALGCNFQRIQFTPDLLPSDITGFSIFDQREQIFKFRKGPIFGQVILADEINRTSPRTQSALLQALDEHAITVDGVTYEFEEPFFVLATENPIEFNGTYSLPEAQLDRFLFKFKLGYPTKDEELKILQSKRRTSYLDQIHTEIGPEAILRWRADVDEVIVDESIEHYIVDLARRTREHRHVYLGASPRASLALLNASKALAFVSDRDYVIPDDVKHLTPYVFGHRIMLTEDAKLSEVTVEGVIDDILSSTPVPSPRSVLT